MKGRLSRLINKKNIVLAVIVLAFIFLAYYSSLYISNESTRAIILGTSFFAGVVYLIYLVYQFLREK